MAVDFILRTNSVLEVRRRLKKNFSWFKDQSTTYLYRFIYCLALPFRKFQYFWTVVNKNKTIIQPKRQSATLSTYENQVVKLHEVTHENQVKKLPNVRHKPFFPDLIEVNITGNDTQHIINLFIFKSST